MTPFLYLLMKKNQVLARFTKEEFDTEVVRAGLFIPFAIDFLPDGTPLVIESLGNISIGNDRIDLNHNHSEMFFGMAVDPEFDKNGYIYTFNLYDYYKKRENSTNRITRHTLSGNKITEHKVIFDGIPFAKFHNGGRIKFGPDGRLYIGTGDDDVGITAQGYNFNTRFNHKNKQKRKHSP